MTVHLGPVDPAMRGLEPSPDSMGYNPRCLSRDFSTFVAERFFTYRDVLNITVGEASRNIETFQNEFQGRFPDAFLGLHTSGHIALGGEATDLFSSPNDPVFFLHHAMVDR